MKAIVLVLLVVLFVLVPAYHVIQAARTVAVRVVAARVVTSCITDAECMHHCPADDVECDGGPQ